MIIGKERILSLRRYVGQGIGMAIIVFVTGKRDDMVMKWNSNNPCFGCQVMMPSGEMRRGPCCFDLCIEVTEDEYERLFKGKDNVKTKGFFERSGDLPTVRIIEIVGECPNHNHRTGECIAEESKPENCRRAEAKKFELCVKTPKGRWREYVIKEHG